MTPSQALLPQKILITGASRGIGAALATYFTDRGHTVYSTSSKDFNFLEPDAVDRCLAAYADADVLINNAGYCDRLDLKTANLDGMKRFREIMDVNFFAPAELSLRFARYWQLTKRPGKIINMLSRVARKGSVESAHYAASKAALLNLTHSLGAAYAATNIGVFGVSPSWVETDILHENAKDLDAEKEALPIKRFLAPEELCPYVRMLVEDVVQYMTGQTIEINGASHFS